MNVAYIFDEGYVPCAAVSMVSLLKNSSKPEEVVFYIFDDGIKEESKSRLLELCEMYRAKIFFIETQKITERLQKLQVQPWRGRYSAYIKLMVANSLPCDMQRVIVIDADTIIDGSVEELETMNLHGHPCAMALEGIHVDYNQISGLSYAAELYNTGVIVYDLPVWKEKRVEERLLEHLIHVRSKYMLPEENPISIVLKKDVERLSPQFNFITQFYVYNTRQYYKRFCWEKLNKKGGYYSFEELKQARDDVRIYHCIDLFTSRPWYKENIHPYTALYDKYLQMTPWSNESKKDEKMSLMAKVEYWLRKNLPQSISDYMYYQAAKITYTQKAKRFYQS